MESCVFCKVVAGELPSHKVYEDDSFTAFLDIHPQSAGHTLIVPKEHHRWVWDVEPSEEYFALARKVARALQKAFGTDEVHMRVFGEEVPHAHIWLYPAPGKETGDKGAFETNAEKVKAALA